VCVSVCLSLCHPLITFEPITGFLWNLVGRYCHSTWPRSHIFNLVASAIPKWRMFKLLSWVYSNTLITFEPFGGIEWNSDQRWRHWRRPWLRTIISRNFNHFKVADFKFLRWAQLFNRLVDLDEILCSGDGVEYYLDFTLCNPIASTIPKWRTFKLLRWVLLLNRVVDLNDILYRNDAV
jgi:hypothetical protein